MSVGVLNGRNFCEGGGTLQYEGSKGRQGGRLSRSKKVKSYVSTQQSREREI